MVNFILSDVRDVVQIGENFVFDVAPIGALSSAYNIRWEIILKGAVPATSNTFSSLSGTVSFLSGETLPKTISIPILSGLGTSFARNFTLRVFEVEASNEAVSRPISQDIEVTLVGSDDPENMVVYDANISSFDDVVVSAGSENALWNGVSGDDTYIITRHQYGNVEILDYFGSSYVQLDRGVSVVSFVEETYDHALGTTIFAAILTLETGATVRIAYPDQNNFSYQIGDGGVLSYSEFKFALSDATPEDPYYVYSSSSVGGGRNAPNGIDAYMPITAKADIIGIGSNFNIITNAAAGDDVYIITRFQYGDVSISDSQGDNLIKFDLSVSIVGFQEDTINYLGLKVPVALVLTLGTGALVTIEYPQSSVWRYQIGNGQVIEYTDLKAYVQNVTNADPFVVVDLAPVFESSSFFFSLSEEASSGVFGVVVAFDIDTSVAFLTYELMGVVPPGVTINSVTGELSYEGVGLDAEVAESYDFVVKVTSDTQSATAQINLVVVDVDDNVFMFTDLPANNITLSENYSDTMIILDEVFAVDRDVTADAVTYDLVPTGNTPVPSGFSMYGNNLVYTGGGIDYEAIENGVINLTLRATSGNNAIFTPIVVNITDVSENPVLGMAIGHQTASVNSVKTFTIPAGSFNDEDANSSLTYSFLVTEANGSALSLPWLQLQGNVFTVSSASLSDVGTYFIVVKAIDNTNLAAVDENVFSLTIAQDQPPVFVQQRYTFSLMEGDSGSVTNPLVVGAVMATDGDSGASDVLTYELVSIDGNGVPAGFSMDNNEIIYTGVAFDREGSSASSSVDLRVKVTSGGVTATADIAVNITDLDEFDPVFSSADVVLNLEEGNFITYFSGSPVVATDLDGGVDVITYSLESSPAGFTIDDLGIIAYSGGGFDLESPYVLPEYTFNVLADSNGTIARKEVTLNIIDINEHSTVFTNSGGYSFVIAENEAGDSGTVVNVGQVEALDDDFSARIVYSLLDAPTFFSIDEDGFITYTGSGFNYESATNSYGFSVNAYDENLSNAPVVQTQVNVRVEDVNDAPVKNVALLSQTAVTLIPMTFSIPTNAFSDEDGDDLRYNFTVSQNGNPVVQNWLELTVSEFSVSSQSVAGVYEVSVTAIDERGVGSVQTSDFTLTITANETPYFTQSYSFDLDENSAYSAATQKTFGTIVATDNDSEDLNITYKIVPINGELPPYGFFISEAGDFVYIGNGVDREEFANGVILVRVEAESFGLTAVTDIAINVADVDDNDPEFVSTAPSILSIDENDDRTNNALELGVVNAIDVDSSNLTADISYHLEGDVPTGLTVLSGGGVSYDGSGFNAEAKLEYNFKVVATSGNKSVKHDVTLQIVDLDEYLPQFVSGTVSKLNINENTTNVNLTTFLGTDSDTSAVITYSLSGTFPVGLVIDEDSGVLSYGGVELDAESAVTSYNFSVVITSNEESVSQNVTLSVVDLDDNDPIFPGTLASYTFSMDENQVGNVNAVDLGDVLATDADTGSTISYSLVSAEVSGFAINNGRVVYIGGGVNLESLTDQYIDITVRATSGTKTKDQNVVVEIIDVDEHGPEFTSASPSVLTIEEYVTTMNFSAAFVATDADFTDLDSDIKYSLDNEPLGLSVDEDTGLATYDGGGFDYETQSSYTFDVIATSHEVTKTQEITLNITIANDNPSVFTSTSPSGFMIDENVKVMNFSTAFVATDEDVKDSNADIRYSLDGEPLGLSIGSVDGLVSYNGEGFDYEDQSSHTFDVIATSRGVRTVKSVTLTINNVNDAPVSVENLLNQQFKQTTEATFSISSTAFADDDGDSLTYTYSISSLTLNPSWLVLSGSEFAVKANSVAGVYDVIVTATDTNNTTASSNFTLTIIEDIPPVFGAQTYTFSFDENKSGASTAFVVGEVLATDSDEASGATLAYALVPIDGVQVPSGFSMNGAELVYSGEAINHEDTNTPTSFALRVQVTSNGKVATADVTVNVNDVDEHDPEFSTTYAFTLSEGVAAHDLVTVMAQDNDSTANIIYSLSQNSIGFSITAGGVVSYSGSGLNHASSSSHMFTVTATSGLKTDTTSIAITVEALELAPVLSLPMVNGDGVVTEDNGVDNSESGVLPVTYHGDLLDLNLHVTTNGATPTFSTTALAFDENNMATVDAFYGSFTFMRSATGTTWLYTLNNGLSTTDGLSFGEAVMEGIKIRYSDNDGNLSAIRILSLTVNGADDAPVFGLGSYTFSTLSENVDASGVGDEVVIGSVSATDVEGDSISYSIISGNIQNNAFSINSSGRIIYTGTGVDYETNSTYSLGVKASANGVGSTVSVQILVQDLVDASLELNGVQAVLYAGTLEQDVDTGLTLMASIPGFSGVFNYEIISGGDKFRLLEDSSGQYKLIAKYGTLFDSATDASVSIRASDDNGANSVDATFTIAVDEEPEFTVEWQRDLDGLVDITSPSTGTVLSTTVTSNLGDDYWYDVSGNNVTQAEGLALLTDGNTSNIYDVYVSNVSGQYIDFDVTGGGVYKGGTLWIYNTTATDNTPYNLEDARVQFFNNGLVVGETTISINDIDSLMYVSLEQAEIFDKIRFIWSGFSASLREVEVYGAQDLYLNTKAGAVIGRANVTFNNANSGGTLTYSLTGVDASYFSVDTSGNITINSIPVGSKPHYEFTVNVMNSSSNLTQQAGIFLLTSESNKKFWDSNEIDYVFADAGTSVSDGVTDQIHLAGEGTIVNSSLPVLNTNTEGTLDVVVSSSDYVEVTVDVLAGTLIYDKIDYIDFINSVGATLDSSQVSGKKLIDTVSIEINDDNHFGALSYNYDFGAALQYGTSGSDSLSPAEGNDSLMHIFQGGEGDDIISAGNSRGNIFIGGQGDDEFYLSDDFSDNSRDTIVYRWDSSATTAAGRAYDGYDTIYNFEVGRDRLVIIDVAETAARTINDENEFLDGFGDGSLGVYWFNLTGVNAIIRTASTVFSYLSFSGFRSESNGLRIQFANIDGDDSGFHSNTIDVSDAGGTANNSAESNPTTQQYMFNPGKEVYDGNGDFRFYAMEGGLGAGFFTGANGLDNTGYVSDPWDTDTIIYYTSEEAETLFYDII